jgi:hypothetical protein
MATLTGKTIAGSYKDLLKINANAYQSGVDSTLRAIEDGDATASALWLATDSALMSGADTKLYFYDADGGEYISADASGVLSIAAGAEIDLTATAVDLNGTLDVSGNTQLSGTVTVGVDGTGKDVKFFGDTATNGYMLWDESTDDLILGSSSKLGIGTATPGSKLHIQGSSEQILQVESTGNAKGILVLDGDRTGADSSVGQIRFQWNNNRVAEISCLSGADTTDKDEGELAFFTAPAGGTLVERVRIDLDGNVGIGTASPAYDFEVKMDTDKHLGITDSQSETGNCPTIVSVNTAHSALVDLGFRADNILFATGSAERMRIDSSGNVGIGTAAPDVLLEIAGAHVSSFGMLHLDSTDHAYLSLDTSASGNDSGIYFSEAGTPQMLIGFDGSENHLRIHDSPAGVDRMVITQAGKVGIGTTAPQANFHLESTDPVFRISDSNSSNTTTATGSIQWYDRNNTAILGQIGYLSTSDLDLAIYNSVAGSVKLFTSATQRMTIDSSGNVIIGSPVATARLCVEETVNDVVVFIDNGATSGNVYIEKWKMTGSSPDNNTSYFVSMEDSSADRLKIFSDGDIQNHDNAYGAFSDERIKQDIRDANSQWDDIKALKVRNFKRKDDVAQYGDDAWEQIGVVAQEVEEAGMDKLVNNSPPSDFELEHCGFGDYVDAVLYEAGDDELREAVEAVEGVEGVEAIEAVEAQDAVYETVTLQRQKVVVSEVEEEVSSTEVVLEDGKYVQKITTETVTKEVSEPQYQDVPLYGEDGEEIGTHRIPEMEDYEEEQLVSEAVEAVEGVEGIEAVEAVEAVEAISIGDVKEEAKWTVKQDEDGEDMQVKSMKYSILYMKAVKALQEAMGRIEGLETKVEALESK